MTLCRNLALFFVLFLPLTCATGLAGGALAGPIPPTRVGYEIWVYLTWVMPLLLPTLVAVPVLHFAYRWLARARGARAARAAALVATPLALLAVHVAVFGLAYVSAPLLALVLGCGAVYGALFGLVRPKPIA